MFKRPSQIYAGMWFLIFLLAPVLSACNFSPSGAAEDENAIQTAAAATIAAAGQQQTIDALQAKLTSQELTLHAPSVTPAPSDTPPPTEAPPPPTAPPATLEPLPTQPLEPPPPPPPPAALMLTANVETRCRQGPSTAFQVVSFILVGQQAEIIGRNPEATWWLIRDPQGKFGNCWVWGETTQPLGDPSGVPVVQPPPPPTTPPQTSFSAAFDNLHICGGVAHLTFAVSNLGNLPFQSSNITIMDVTNGVGLAGPESSNNPFVTSPNGCPPGLTALPGGATAWVTKGIGMLPASGTRGRGIIVLCTLPNLAGVCVEQRANFRFP